MSERVDRVLLAEVRDLKQIQGEIKGKENSF